MVAARDLADHAVMGLTGSDLRRRCWRAPAWESFKVTPKKANGTPTTGWHASPGSGYLLAPDILERLAGLAGRAGSHHEAARLFGAAHAIGAHGHGPIQGLGSTATRASLAAQKHVGQERV